jgi:hypothetical protein
MRRVVSKDILARVVGILAFLAGIALLIFVFLAAYRLFSATSPGVALTQPDSPGAPTVANLTGAALMLLAQVGLLFIMTLVGSLVAARGVQLYLACETPVADERSAE